MKQLSVLLCAALVWSSAAPSFAAGFKANTGVAANVTARPIPGLPHSAVAPALTRAGAAANAAATGVTAIQAGVAVSAAGAAVSPAAAAGQLGQAVADRLNGAQLFDGAVGLRPLPKPNLPQGFDLDEAPSAPKPQKVGGVEINSFGIPGARSAGGLFDAGPRLLQADHRSEADVERALRAMVDSDAARYGVASAELKTVHVRRIEGKDGQADTIYAYFRQQRPSRNVDGTVEAVSIQGSYLSFTVKVVKDQPVLMAAMAQLYPNMSVVSDSRYSADELKQRAEQVLPQAAGVELSFVERKIVHHKGRWKTVNLYSVQGLPMASGVLVAVDVDSGQVFAWDARHGVTTAAPAAAKAEGEAKTKAEAQEARPNGKPVLSELPLPHLNVAIDGKQGVTDAAGKFSGEIAGADAEFEAALDGTWVTVNDEAGNPVKVKAKVKAGTGNVVLADADAKDLLRLNQLNMYVWISKIHDWWSERLGRDKRIDRQIPVNVNIDDECNAYYTPGRPSLNFFRESRNNGECSDTGRPGVGAHEYGHFVDDMIGGIVDGGLSEGWGDIGSMFLLGSPVIGDGFLRHRTPSYIRHGENAYQYGKWDEVHDQGQAWMGFAWKLRKALVAKLGEAAGAAAAEAMIVPTLLAKATDIPGQMALVLLNAMDKNGAIQHEQEIRAAARAHGIDLPANPRGMIDTLITGIGSWFGGISVTEDSSRKFPEDFSPITIPQVTTRTIVVKGGKAAVEQLKADVEAAVKTRPGDYAGVSVKIETVSGMLGSQLKIGVSGEDKARAYMSEQILRLAGAKSSTTPETQVSPESKLRGLSIRAETPVASVPATTARNAYWITMEVKDGQKPAVLPQAKEILSVHQHSTGMWWWKKSFATYVVDVEPGKEDVFKAAGFQQLGELKMRLIWRRISDINGWGVEVNGENRRTAYQDFTFKAGELEKGFELMRDFETNPLAVLGRYPADAKHVGEATVSAWERGYVIDSSIWMATGNDWTKDERMLYSNAHRSGYYRGSPFKEEAPEAAAPQAAKSQVPQGPAKQQGYAASVYVVGLLSVALVATFAVMYAMTGHVPALVMAVLSALIMGWGTIQFAQTKERYKSIKEGVNELSERTGDRDDIRTRITAREMVGDYIAANGKERTVAKSWTADGPALSQTQASHLRAAIEEAQGSAAANAAVILAFAEGYGAIALTLTPERIRQIKLEEDDLVLPGGRKIAYASIMKAGVLYDRAAGNGVALRPSQRVLDQIAGNAKPIPPSARGRGKVPVLAALGFAGLLGAGALVATLTGVPALAGILASLGAAAGFVVGWIVGVLIGANATGNYENATTLAIAVGMGVLGAAGLGWLGFLLGA